jgi:hypothetical protein
MIRLYQVDERVADIELVDGKMLYKYFSDEGAREGIPDLIESVRHGRSDIELYHLLPQIFCGQFFAGHVNTFDEPGPDAEIVEPENQK